MHSIYLVSCSKVKLTVPSPAAELYQSLWFRTAHSLIERQQAQWFILSAKYGLLAPTRLIEPYEQTLKLMTAGERRLWAQDTAEEIFLQVEPCHLTLLAGKYYREYLTPLLESRGFTWEAPLSRLGIGSQISFMQRKIVAGDSRF